MVLQNVITMGTLSEKFHMNEQSSGKIIHPKYYKHLKDVAQKIQLKKGWFLAD